MTENTVKTGWQTLHTYNDGTELQIMLDRARSNGPGVMKVRRRKPPVGPTGETLWVTTLHFDDGIFLGGTSPVELLKPHRIPVNEA